MFEPLGSTETPMRYLVCGLGSLGQYCVKMLRDFGAIVSAIDVAEPSRWDVKELPDLLENLVIGDCRQPEILQQAKIQHCQAILCVTSDERINIETAFASRLLNPQVRLIVRSAEKNLNALLQQELGNFVAFEAKQLSAPTFAVAALRNDIQGFISIDSQLLRVVQCQIHPEHRWCGDRLLHQIDSRTRRLLSHRPATGDLPQQFHQWQPEARVQAGDQVTYVELTEEFSPPMRTQTGWRKRSRRLSQLRTVKLWKTFRQWLGQQQSHRVGFAVGAMVLSLIGLGAVILKATYAQESWLRALYVATVMLLGSYDTVLGALSPNDSVPVWLRFMNLSYMLAGTASIAVLYALLTESLLVSKFQLPNRRPPVPSQGHVVLLGLGPFGRQVALLLQQLKQPLVGVSNTPLEANLLPQMPLVVVSDFADALAQVNLATAKSLVLATDHEMVNLEIGLMARALNPQLALVIRTFDPDFSDNLARLLPDAQVLCAYALSAEAFAASVLGDNILSLLRINEQTVLVIEYVIQSGSGLDGLLLAEIAYGYQVVPIAHQREHQVPAKLMPSDDIKLEPGDRLIALANVESSHRLAREEPLPPDCQVQIDSTFTSIGEFDAARVIARVSGCGMQMATSLMRQLPAVLPVPLYKPQALRLIRELKKVQTQAQLTIRSIELDE